MTATTSLGLIYPTGPDRPCDSWQTWDQFVGTLDGLMTSLNSDLNRTARARPIAKVSTDVPQLLRPGTVLVFDTVQVDTDGMVDLNLAPTVIAPKRAGRYAIEAVINWDSLDLGAQVFSFITSGDANSIAMGMETSEIPWTQYPSGSNFRGLATADPDDQDTFGIAVSSVGTAGDDPRVVHAELTVTWMADL